MHWKRIHWYAIVVEIRTYSVLVTVIGISTVTTSNLHQILSTLTGRVLTVVNFIISPETELFN